MEMGTPKVLVRGEARMIRPSQLAQASNHRLVNLPRQTLFDVLQIVVDQPVPGAVKPSQGRSSQTKKPSSRAQHGLEESCHPDFRLFAPASILLPFAHMVRLTRLLLILLVLGFVARPAFAAEVRESTVFTNAMATFKISKELAVQDFADFIRKYPNSVHVPEAILHEAQGMLYGGDVTNAIR